MTKLTIKPEWLEPGYQPKSLLEAPFQEVKAELPFPEVMEVKAREPTDASVGTLASHLVEAVIEQLRTLQGPVHLLLSGGYDSRILAALLVAMDLDVTYVTDGMEPPVFAVLDYLGIPPERRYVHDMTTADPYGIVGATCDGFAPLWVQQRFMPEYDLRPYTLVTGLGGGEWFSYPASGWHAGKQHRIPHTDPINMWLDCWPNYTLIHKVWGRGYGRALHPYTTRRYAEVAGCCRREWLVDLDPARHMDLVRNEMMKQIDDQLEWLGYSEHIYRWNMSESQERAINRRYHATRPWNHDPAWGEPADMDRSPHACTLGGFATWIEKLKRQGNEVLMP